MFHYNFMWSFVIIIIIIIGLFLYVSITKCVNYSRNWTLIEMENNLFNHNISSKISNWFGENALLPSSNLDSLGVKKSCHVMQFNKRPKKTKKKRTWKERKNIVFGAGGIYVFLKISCLIFKNLFLNCSFLFPNVSKF